MADPFEQWRMVWASAVAQGVERFVDSFVPNTALAHPRPAEPDLSAFATLGRVRIELSTMLLLEQPEPRRSRRHGPRKARRLARAKLSKAPQALASVPPEMIQQMVALGGGRVSGSLSFALWSDSLSPEFTAEAALQCCVDPAIMAKFNVWNLRTVDLPGAYFVQTAEWVFRENRLARVSFPALGRPALLSAVEAPIFVLAAADDEVVSLPQATAAKSLCRRTRVKIRIAPGRHLSLFMGRRTVGGVWRDIGQWLAEPEPEPALAPAKRARKRG